MPEEGPHIPEIQFENYDDIHKAINGLKDAPAGIEILLQSPTGISKEWIVGQFDKAGIHVNVSEYIDKLPDEPEMVFKIMKVE